MGDKRFSSGAVMGIVATTVGVIFVIAGLGIVTGVVLTNQARSQPAPTPSGPTQSPTTTPSAPETPSAPPSARDLFGRPAAEARIGDCLRERKKANVGNADLVTSPCTNGALKVVDRIRSPKVSGQCRKVADYEQRITEPGTGLTIALCLDRVR